MASLPTELLDMITAYLAPPDLKNFRLCSQTFSAIGARPLFRKIRFFFHPEALRWLRYVSEHPILSKCVRAVWLEADHILWASCRSMRMPCTHDGWRRETLGGIASDIPGLRQRQLAAWQQESLIERWFKDDVSEALARLPLLEEFGFACSESRGPHFFRPVLLRAPSHLQAVKDMRMISHTHDPDLLADLFVELLVLCSRTCPKLRFIQSGPISLLSSVPLLERFNRALKVSCANLTDFCLDFTPEVVQDAALTTSRAALQSHTLHRFLKNMPFLRRLSVVLNFVSADALDWERFGHIDDLFAQHTWSELEYLRIGELIGTEEKLLDLYRRHAKTLRHIYIVSMDLGRGGSWFSVFSQMQEMLSLESADMKGHFNIVMGDEGFGGDIWMQMRMWQSDGPNSAKMMSFLNHYLVHSGIFPFRYDTLVNAETVEYAFETEPDLPLRVYDYSSSPGTLGDGISDLLA